MFFFVFPHIASFHSLLHYLPCLSTLDHALVPVSSHSVPHLTLLSLPPPYLSSCDSTDIEHRHFLAQTGSSVSPSKYLSLCPAVSLCGLVHEVDYIYI